MRTLLFALIVVTFAGCHCGGTAADNNSGPDAGPQSGDDGGADGGAGTCASLNDACSTAVSCCAGLSCISGYCRPAGTAGCGLNSAYCDGGCVVTLTDPSNCGGCNISCASNQVCTGGSCRSSGSCPEGLTACQGSCVDLQSNNANCGACSNPCPPGQGCAGGKCVQAIALDGGAPPACPGGGPPVSIATDGGTTCAGNIAQVTFRWAMCSCADVVTSGPSFRTDAFNSALGQDAGLGGGVGANGNFTASNTFDIGGTAWLAGQTGLRISAPGTSRQDLWVNGPTSAGGSLAVGSDAHINGDVTGNASIGGTLFVPAGAAVGSGIQAASGITRGPVSVAPPCDCAPGQLIDVAGIVQDGRTNNDNAALGLNPAVFENLGSARRLDLPCGRYYLTQITSSAPVAIAVHGRAALFIGGDVRPSSALTITVDAQAELDIFIGGTLQSSSTLGFGSTETPAQTRIYIAGGPVRISASALIAGNFYLPYSQFTPSAPVSLYGSLFCGSYMGSQNLQIHYDRAILTAGSECGTPPPADGGTPSGCSSCRDCGNQACLGGSCGPCTSNSQCCAPLQCVQGACSLRLN